jgi:hypothetical protein
MDMWIIFPLFLGSNNALGTSTSPCISIGHDISGSKGTYKNYKYPDVIQKNKLV